MFVCKIFKNIFFKEHLRTKASASLLLYRYHYYDLLMYPLIILEKPKKPFFYDHSNMLRKRNTVRPTNDRVRFPCYAEGQGQMHYIWLKNGRPFKHIKAVTHEEWGKSARVIDFYKKKMISQKSRDGDLEIDKLVVSDGGKYTCVAFNLHGNISFTYDLRILCK